MCKQDVEKLVESTGDAAFAVDGTGVVAAWNRAAEALFGLSAPEARGRICSELVRGRDETGPVCREECWIFLQPGRRPLRSFDLEVKTRSGPEWCSVVVLGVGDSSPQSRFSIHVFSRIGLAKRLEKTVTDYVAGQTLLAPEALRTALASRKDHVAAVSLTPRESEVLAHLARGSSTRQIGKDLGISEATASNHIQRILAKLGVHSRIEAVRRAESAGLI